MRIAIVNDVVMAVEGLRRIIEHSAMHTVAWSAENGQQAVDKAIADTPDLILMDMIMPVMDGVEATRQIMAVAPCPILVVTSSIDDNIDYVFRAMGAGALDAACTPVVNDCSEVGAELLKKIALIGHLGGNAKSTQFSLKVPAGNRPVYTSAMNLVAVGASSGGPQALLSFLTEFQPQQATAVVIAQHIDERFAPRLAAWLDQQTTWQVQLAEQGTVLRENVVYIARSHQHLVMQAGTKLGYSDVPESQLPYKPSVNLLFDSLAAHWPGTLCAVVLTGMGDDGAAGLARLRTAGHLTIAQDEASAAVYGMPRAARESNAAAVAMNPKDMGHYINHYFREKSRLASGS